MFKSFYNVLGSDAVCQVMHTASTFSLESKLTNYLKKLTNKCGWKFIRVDTKSQQGFPDILLLKQTIYWQIEAKILRKKALNSLEDDLKWQFGQIGYLKRAISLNLNYMLAVGKGSNIAFIKGNNNEISKCVSYPNFVGCL